MSFLGGLFTELLLASTSPARRVLFSSLGLPFRSIAPEVGEHVPDGTPVPQAVALLADRKARAVLSRFPQALVVGADQLVSIDGVALGKPDSEPAAAVQLAALSGRAHDIVTGVCVAGPGYLVTEVDTARLHMRPLTQEEQRGYLTTGEWKGCAGGYRIESRGQALFSRIEGDRTSIQGLPMPRVIRLLREAGVRFF